jgi:YVTN family beta-propeller protein
MKHKWTFIRLLPVCLIVLIVAVGLFAIDQSHAVASNGVSSVLFSDDFSGDLSQWPEPDRIGDWYIDQEQLVGTGWGYGTDGWIYAGDYEWEDYILQADVHFVNDNAMLVVRSTQHWYNEYRIDVWQDGGENSNTYTISKYFYGYNQTLKTGTSPVPITNPSTVKVMVSDENLFLFINNVLVAQVEDLMPLPNGRIGLGVIWYYQTRFDNVMVTTLPPIMMLPFEQSKYGRPGNTVTYEIELENHTGVTDSFNLEVLPGNTWTTNLSTPQVGPIEDGESASFEIYVDIPADAQPLASDSATIQASSVASPDITATAVVNSHVMGEETAYVTLEDSHKIALVDVASQVVFDEIETNEHGCYNPWRSSITPDGDYAYFSCYGSGSVLVIETSTNSVVTNITDLPYADDIAFTPSGDHALVGSRQYSQVAIVDTETYAIEQFIYTSGVNRSIAVHPYMPRAYVTSSAGEILVVDTSTFETIASIYVGGDPWDVAASPNGSWVFAGDRWGAGLSVIDASMNTLYTTVTGLGEITGLEVSSDSGIIYAGGLCCEVWIIDGNTFSLITNVYTNSAAWGLALTGDGTQMYVGNVSDHVLVIDAVNFTVSGSIPMPGSPSRGIAITPQYVADGVFLIPPMQAQNSGHGEVVTYEESLFNNSGGTETFDLSISGYTWDTQLSVSQIGPIADGESAGFSVYVTVPTDAPWYDTDTATVLAAGQADPSLTAQAQLVTTAYAPAQISVDPASLSSTQYVGEVTTQDFTISNGEGVTLTYDIHVGMDELVRITSDDYWRVSPDYVPGWELPGFDDSGWDFTYAPASGCGDYCFSEPGHDDVLNMWNTDQSPTIYLRRSFVLDGSNVLSAELWSGCDDDFDFYVNGELVASDHNGWAGPTIITDIKPYLVMGENTFAAIAIDTGGCHGMCVDVHILLEPQLWLSADPTSGDVATNSSDLIQITFDASGMQPGNYGSALFINSNDPLQPVVTVPASLTVEPTADMGQVAGTVTDGWSGDPLTATVELVGVYTMLADPDYNIWAVAGNYSLTAYASGYITVTLSVEILAGEITVQDIALESALPRLGELPEQIYMSIPTGTIGTQTLEIFNTGPVPLDFAFFELEELKSLKGVDGLTGKHILYDMYHGQGDVSPYSILTSDLVAAGATIDGNSEPFDEDTLEGYDILWITSGGGTWSYPELAVLDQWLADGGTILIQGDNSSAVDAPASIFGIEYHSDGWCHYGPTTLVYPHPITEGVDEVYLEWTCSHLSDTPDVIVQDPDLQPHMIAALQGRGKMVVVAGSDFNDGPINNSDNRLLAMNTFLWLAMPVYGDIPWLSETPESGVVHGHSVYNATLTFDATNLAIGGYEGFLAIEHSDASQDSPVLIPVQLTVTVPEPISFTTYLPMVVNDPAGILNGMEGDGWLKNLSSVIPYQSR